MKTNSSRSAFALVIALSLMAFVLVLLLTITTLVQVETQSAHAHKLKLESEQAALLSLNIAIGNLQAYAGLDQRVTAPAQSMAGLGTTDQTKQLTGVWRAWEGLDHDKTTGFPIAPDYGSKLDNGELAIDSANSGRFLGWLTSSYEAVKNSGATLTATDLPTVAESPTSVELLGKGTLGLTAVDEDEVHLEPTVLSDRGTAIAWWVQGENTKVRLRAADAVNDNFEATEQMLVSPGPSGASFDIDDTSNAGRAASRASLDMLANSAASSDPKPKEFFHDLSVSSKGLLTNTANGGWRRDLSLFSENFSSIPDGFSSMTLSPGNEFFANKTSSSTNESPVYPWDDTPPANRFGATSWAGFVDYSTQYKDIISSGNEVASFQSVKTAVGSVNLSLSAWANDVQLMPVLARVHLVISLSAQEEPADSGTYAPAIILNPVLTLWNPYSVALDLSGVTYYLKLNEAACPLNLTFTAGSSTSVKDLAEITGEGSATYANISLGSPELWLPGEVRVFSATGAAIDDRDKGQDLPISSGYRPSGGFRYAVPGFTNLSGETSYSITKAVNEAEYDEEWVEGVGFAFTMSSVSKYSGGPNRYVHCMLDLEDAQKMLGKEVPLIENPNPPSLSSLALTPSPVVSIISGLRYARDVNPGMDNILVNGIHFMNPAVGFMAKGSSSTDPYSAIKGRFDTFPYDIQFFVVNGVEGDPGMPSGIDNELEGYLGSGFGSNDGLTNLVLLEIPTRPLRTLGDLSSFNVNATDLYGIYTLNAFGNSTASPFIDSDEIRIKEPSLGEIGHDHSYAINHVLLDDWFVSSVAPETNEWSAGVQRTIQEVYADHLSGTQALPNHYYKPLEMAGDTDAAAANFLGDPDAWKKVAAELEVDGMFNINSTSELAWAMLLKRNFAADEGGVLTLNDSTPGNTAATASLELSTGTPFPRTMLTSDGASGGIPSLSQPLRFTPVQITALAREIVGEIKERGPFLSLSEFFNRQLSSDPELAKAGAVEAALQHLAESSGAENPYSQIQADFSDQASTTDVLGNALSYPFPEAAEGNPAYGFPGWTRQGDILRSVTGVLSARDDTFTIRAYGDARDISGKIVSKALCEAVVQRTAEYVDNSSVSGDNKYVLPADDTLQSEANKRFGRRFQVVQFRWLNPDEV